MTLSKKIISVAVLSAFTSAAFAVSTNSVININVTKGDIIEITGSANATQQFDFATADVIGGSQPLGDLGVSSNISGDCNLSVTSTNNYELIHPTTLLSLHGTGNKYSVEWANGTTFSTLNNGLDQVITGCNEAISALSMNNAGLTEVATDAGTYSDTLTIVVTND